MLPALEEKVRDYFGHAATVVLKVRVDPDGLNESDELFAYVRSNMPIVDLLESLDSLSFDWWLDLSASVRERVTLSLDVE